MEIRFYRQTPPAVVSRRGAGAGDAAAAGVGRAMQGLGGSIASWAERKAARGDVLAASRAWRQLDGWRLEYMRGLAGRREELSSSALDDESGSNVTGYELELGRFPDAMNAEFERVAAGLSAQGRAMLEERYNAHAPSWSDAAVQLLEGMEMEDVTAEILSLAGQDRASDGLELLALYADRYSPKDRQAIEAALVESAHASRIKAAKGVLRQIADAQGWDAASEQLNDPAFQELYDLDIGDAAGIKREIETFVRDESARAAGLLRAQQEANNDGVLADAWEGKLDLATLPQRVRSNEVDATVAAQARQIMATPKAEDDLDAYVRAQRWLSDVRTGRLKRDAALAQLRGVAGSLTAATFKSLAADIEKAGDPADPASSPQALLLDRMLDEHYESLDTFGTWGTPDAQRQYLQTKGRFRHWLANHPEASDEEVATYWQDLVKPVAVPSFQRKIAKWWWDWSFAGILQRSYRQARDVFGGAPGPAAFDFSDPSDAPRTQQEFEERVKALPAGSAEQKAYYDKWAGKF